jgi:ParB/RepB/Spo0J family partition protein
MGQYAHAALSASAAAASWRVLILKVEDVRPNPRQPRQEFDEKRLSELADSIRSQGVLKPITVTRVGDAFEIIDGERRWRACQAAGLSALPAIAQEIDPLTGALIENSQRVALNVVEEARAIATFVVEQGGVAEAARALGKSESWISKRKKVGGAPDFVLACGSKDLDALYEIAKLAETDPEGARELSAAGVKKTLLRETARRARKGGGEKGDGEIAIDVTSPTEAPNKASFSKERGRGPAQSSDLGVAMRKSPINDTGKAAVEQFFAPADDAGSSWAVEAVRGMGTGSNDDSGDLPPTLDAKAPRTLVVEGVRLERDILMLESTGGAMVELQLSPDVERELFELIREHLCP